MRGVIKIGGRDVVLNEAQLETLVALMREVVFIKDEYIGSNKGDDGTNYKKLVRSIPMEELLGVNLMPDDYIDTLIFKTNLHDEAAKSK
jgi:hypothetical protein